MMDSKERVKKVFNFELPDRLPVYDLLQNGLNLNPDIDYDIVIVNDLNADGQDVKDKFKMLACVDAFEDLCYTFGLESILWMIGKDAASVGAELKKSTYKMLRQMPERLEKYKDTNGVWLWSDIAYKKGLYFSKEFYVDKILPLHKEICAFFKNEGLPVVMHSDGNLNGIMPYLIEAGFSGLHPVESSSGMDILKLKNIYKDKIVFLGGLGLDILKRDSDESAISDLRRKIEILSEESGYILGFESPIGKDIDIEKYKSILKIVRECGKSVTSSY